MSGLCKCKQQTYDLARITPNGSLNSSSFPSTAHLGLKANLVAQYEVESLDGKPRRTSVEESFMYGISSRHGS